MVLLSNWINSSSTQLNLGYSPRHGGVFVHLIRLLVSSLSSSILLDQLILNSTRFGYSPRHGGGLVQLIRLLFPNEEAVSSLSSTPFMDCSSHPKGFGTSILQQVFRSFIRLEIQFSYLAGVHQSSNQFNRLSLCHGGFSVLLSDWSKVDLNSILLDVLSVMGELQVLLSHWRKLHCSHQSHNKKLFFQLSPICCLTISAPSSLFNCSFDSRSWVSVLLCLPDVPF